MKLSKLLVISVRQLLGHPLFNPIEWENFSRKAYVEPIVVRDGFHDFVLMAAPDYATMQEASTVYDGLSKASRGELERFAAYLRSRDEVQAEIDAPIGSPDLAILVPALAEMARTNAPPSPARPYVPCRCQAAGRIVCSPSDRC